MEGAEHVSRLGRLGRFCARRHLLVVVVAIGALGIATNVPFESYVPMIVLAIVFGLSVASEVFPLKTRLAWPSS